MAVNPWDTVSMSAQSAAKALGEEMTEKNMPATWPELRRLHKELWARVYARN